MLTKNSNSNIHTELVKEFSLQTLIKLIKIGCLSKLSLDQSKNICLQSLMATEHLAI